MLETMHIDNDIVDNEIIISCFHELLSNNPQFLDIDNDEIKVLLKKIATKELIQTYLALHKMTSTDDEYISCPQHITDKILDIVLTIKSEYTQKESEELAKKIIKHKELYKSVLSEQLTKAKEIVHNMIYGPPVIKQHDENLEKLIGVPPAKNNKHWDMIPIAKIISPNGTPIHSPGTSPDTNVPAEILFSKKSNFSYGYPAIPGDSPFVTPENSPKLQKKKNQQSPILNAACKSALMI